MFRIACAFVVVVLSTMSVHSAELKKLVVRCVEKAEATPDDVFLEFIRDGQAVAFTKADPKGTSAENTIAMKNGDSLTLDTAVLSKLTFTQTLVIHVKDKDITRNEPIGTLKLAPGDVTNTYVSKGKDVGAYEYQVDYVTTK